VEALVNAKAFTLNSMLNTIFARDSWFLDEGKILLIDEFVKDYGTYYTILSLISSSKTSRTEMESVMGVSVGGFLDRLEHDFNWIRKIRPVFSKAGSRTVKYQIIDNFLNFWFRFVFKYRSAVELNNFNYLKEIAKRDYTTYSGHILERYFTQKIAAEENLSGLGAYWEKGNQNEIDIVGVNDLEKTAIVAEVKRQKKNIDINALREKAKHLMPNLEGYDIQYRGLSIEDM
jgi:AAA+ ATPase superfamily predicted ATPase